MKALLLSSALLLASFTASASEVEVMCSRVYTGTSIESEVAAARKQMDRMMSSLKSLSPTIKFSAPTIGTTIEKDERVVRVFICVIASAD